MANKTIRDFHGSFNVSEAYTTYKSEDQIDEATPPSGPKNPDKPHVGKTAHEKKVERYQQYLAKKKRDREQHLRNNPGLTQNRRQPVSQNAFYSKRAFRNQEINASYDPDLSEASKPEYEVKYSNSKRGPIKVTKFMTQDEAQAFLKKIRGEGMNGIVSKGGKPVRTPMKEDAKSDRLAKIARAAAARKKDQEAQKEKEKEKHYAASKKSRAAIDYLKKGGNKDQFGRVREEEQIGEAKVIKVRGGDAVEIGMSKRGGKIQYYWKDKSGLKNVFDSPEKLRYSLRNTANFSGAEKAVSQLGEANQKYDSTKGDKQARRRGEKEVGKLINKENPKAPGYEYSKKRLARLDRKKKANEEVEQTDESLRQRADDSMTFGNRQAAFSTAFKKKHGRAPTKQELRDAGVGKGGDNPAGAKAYQKAISKLRPASRSGIKDKFVHNEEVEIDEAQIRKTSSGGEMIKKEKYQKLMKKYGNTPITKVPQKDWHQILTLGDELRAKNLIENEEIEQVVEEFAGWIAMYNGKKVEIKKSEAKDLYAAKLKAIQMLKVPKSKQGLLAIKPAVNEEIEQVDEVGYPKQTKKGVIAKAARAGTPPFTVVVIDRLNKVVKQEKAQMADAIPAFVHELQKRYPKGEYKISVEDKGGSVVYSESFVGEAGMIGRTKPSRELNVQKFEKKYLGTKSLKDAKRAAHKAERKKGKMDIQKGD